MYPIIIPVYREPETCPDCGKIENKVEVCKHCRHEYPSVENDRMFAIFSLAALIIAGVLTPFIARQVAFREPSFVDYVLGFLISGALTIAGGLLLTFIAWAVITAMSPPEGK